MIHNHNLDSKQPGAYLFCSNQICYYLYILTLFRVDSDETGKVDESSQQSNASLLLTPKHVGEAMSAGDPYYRPNCKAQNPFATLKRFKVRQPIDTDVRWTGQIINVLPAPPCLFLLFFLLLLFFFFFFRTDGKF